MPNSLRSAAPAEFMTRLLANPQVKTMQGSQQRITLVTRSGVFALPGYCSYSCRTGGRHPG